MGKILAAFQNNLQRKETSFFCYNKQIRWALDEIQPQTEVYQPTTCWHSEMSQPSSGEDFSEQRMLVFQTLKMNF